MKGKSLVALITGVLECLLFSGLLFGWASLRYVLQQEGYFSYLCDAILSTNAVVDHYNSTSPPSASTVVTITTSEFLTAANRSLGYTSKSGADNASLSSIEEYESSDTQQYPSCDTQFEQLNLVFTIASTLLSFSTLINGYIFDRFGTWVSRIIAIVLFTMGCVLTAVSSIETSWLLYPSMTCFAVGGILLLITNLEIGNLFGRFRSSVITMMSGALDSSSFVFLMFKMLYDAGVTFTAIFHATAWCTVFLLIRTFVLLPRLHIPFPLPEEYEYGIRDCPCGKKKPEQKELDLINPSYMKSEEGEALTEPSDNDQKGTKEPSVVKYLKSSLLWCNIMHFSLLQLRNYFFMSSLVEWLEAFDPDDLSKYLVAFGICQLFGVFFAPFNGLLIDGVSRILSKKHGSSDLVPLQAVCFSAIATSLLGTLFSVIIVIPSLSLQYFAFILQVIFRSFLYGGNMSFIAVAFPGEHFGKLYGFTMFFGGCVSLLQFPLFALVLRKMEGDFIIMNIIFVFVCLITLLHPFNIWRYCRNEESVKGESFVAAEN